MYTHQIVTVKVNFAADTPIYTFWLQLLNDPCSSPQRLLVSCCPESLNQVLAILKATTYQDLVGLTFESSHLNSIRAFAEAFCS